MSADPLLDVRPVRGVTLRQRVVPGRIPEGAASGTGKNVRYAIRDGCIAFQNLLNDRSSDAAVGEVTPLGDEQVLIRSVVPLSVALSASTPVLAVGAMAVVLFLSTGALATPPVALAIFGLLLVWYLWAREQRRADVYHEEIRRLLTPPRAQGDVSARDR
jgi:hypothetical protein